MITGFSCCCTPTTAKPTRAFPCIKRVSLATISLSGFTFPLGDIKHYKQRTLVPATRFTASWSTNPRAPLDFISESLGSLLSLKDELRIIARTRNTIKWLQRRDYFEIWIAKHDQERRKRENAVFSVLPKNTSFWQMIRGIK